MSRKRTLLAGLVVACTSLLYSQSGLPDRCGNSPLPFAAIEVKHPIDTSCGIKGNPSASQNSQIQNAIKNNFCAAVGNKTPETFTPQMLVDLQTKTTVRSGYQQEPADRKALQALGEGKLIRMKAYLYEAHHADLGGGESVNCNGKIELQNDVHMALVADPNAKECQSVTAEISPHYRISNGVVAAQHNKPRISAQLLGHAPLNGGKCRRSAGGKLQAARIVNLALKVRAVFQIGRAHV